MEEILMDKFRARLIHECQSGSTIDDALSYMIMRHNSFVKRTPDVALFTGYSLTDADSLNYMICLMWEIPAKGTLNKDHFFVPRKMLFPILENSSRWATMYIE